MTPELGTATLIKDRLPGSNGHAALYRLSEPLIPESMDENVIDVYEYVVVSAVNVPYSGPETYIFAADSDGNIIDFAELPGSFRGALDHRLALRSAGYNVVLELSS